MFFLFTTQIRKETLISRTISAHSQRVMDCFAPPFFPTAKTIHPRVSICNRRTPPTMSQFNAGEDYMRQLANQSTENARLRQQAAANVPTPPPAKEASESGPYLRDGINAGEEYIRALAAKSAGAPEMVEDVAKVPFEEPQEPQDPVAAQLDALNREAEMLEKAIAAAEKIPGSAADIDIDEQIAAIEGRLNATSPAYTPSKKVQDPMSEYEKMRAEVERSVTPNKRVEVERLVSPNMQPDVEEKTGSVSDKFHHMRSGMIEMRMEVERFSNEMKLAQEKHDNNMKNIIETYMPDV